MLVLTRNAQQSIVIETSDGTIVITVCGIKDNQVKIGFDAPDNIDIWRTELLDESAA
jgi:carbon storage regulator CsrA